MNKQERKKRKIRDTGALFGKRWCKSKEQRALKGT